jgi:hypothetical protein
MEKNLFFDFYIFHKPVKINIAPFQFFHFQSFLINILFFIINILNIFFQNNFINYYFQLHLALLSILNE